MIQSEQQFKRSFTPLISKKDGKAQLTFGGYKHSISKIKKEPIILIVFSCLDVTHENPQNIGIVNYYSFSETNILGKLLKTMGYVHKVKEVVVDKTEEFGHKVVDENFNDIYDFLDSQRGLIFKGTLFKKEGSNFHTLDVLTIERVLDKAGNQKRAYQAEDGLSESDLNIDIEANGEDNLTN